jgi:hypothetical protein
VLLISRHDYYWSAFVAIRLSSVIKFAIFAQLSRTGQLSDSPEKKYRVFAASHDLHYLTLERRMKSLFTCNTLHVRQRSITRLASHEARREEAGLNQVIANHALLRALETLPVTILSSLSILDGVFHKAGHTLRE